MQSPHQNRGFTLIEMLAVVAIVGILAAVTFPTLTSIRQKSAATKCVSNLRTLATAHHAYRGEHNGKGPPNVGNQKDPSSEGYEFTEGHTVTGINMLRAYYRDGDRFIWTSDHKYIEEPTEVCPSREVPGDENGYMMTVLFSQTGRAGDKSFLTFTHPAQTPLLWDGVRASSGNMRQPIPLRHNGGINMAFLDGHIEYVQGDDKRLYSDYFYTLFNSGTPNPAQLGKGQKLGVTSF